MREAAEELGVLPELLELRSKANLAGLIGSLDVLKAAAKRRVRELAREHHPDHGGDLQRMQRINAAADIIRGVELGLVLPRSPELCRQAGLPPGRSVRDRQERYVPHVPPVRTRIPFWQMARAGSDGRPDVRGGIEMTWDPLDYDGVPEWPT